MEEKKVVLITGGAMGQGRAHAYKYAENGFNVVLADMLDPSHEAFKETIASCEAKGAKVLAKKANITSTEDMEALFASAWETFGRLDVVIANAGVINFGYTWELTDEQVEKVCKVVGLEHFIKTLPKGINTELSESDEVSAGQKQLLTIARGMLQDTPFLILDEATSNVDTRTEELVQLAMDKLTEGKTSFIIAHRLSTIVNSDKIMYLERGKIIAEGTHEELLKNNEIYKEVFESQTQEKGNDTNE